LHYLLDTLRDLPDSIVLQKPKKLCFNAVFAKTYPRCQTDWWQKELTGKIVRFLNT